MLIQNTQSLKNKIMREIKFRAWNDKDKKWLLGYEYPNLGGFSMFGEIMAFGEYLRMLNSFSLEDWKFIKLMQYTGENDKNNKEIYEGDVLKSASGRDTYTVMWEHSGWIRKPINGGWRTSSLWVGSCRQTIIGNIYENPKLLNSEQNPERSVATDDSNADVKQKK
jgi:uncharacterized phage protein (TIGR01671 family)